MLRAEPDPVFLCAVCQKRTASDDRYCDACLPTMAALLVYLEQTKEAIENGECEFAVLLCGMTEGACAGAVQVGGDESGRARIRLAARALVHVLAGCPQLARALILEIGGSAEFDAAVRSADV